MVQRKSTYVLLRINRRNWKRILSGYRLMNKLEAGCSTTSVEQLKTELSDSVNLAFVSIQDKITTLTDICSQFCSSVNSHTNTVGPRRLSVATSSSISSNRPTTVVDRSRNVVLYGVEDSRERDSWNCLLYTSPSPRDRTRSRMPSSA